MRVAIVSLRTVHHERSEAARRRHRLARLLEQRGHDVHVACARWWDGAPIAKTHEGIEYHNVVEDPEHPRSFWMNLPVVLRSIKPDVVHAAEEPPSGTRGASIGARLARSPLVLEWYGEAGEPEGRPYRRAAGRGSTIVTPSRMVQTWVRELGATEDRTAVIPTPIDMDRIESVPVDETPDIVTARRLDGDANVDSLLLGLAELRDRDWSARIIGDGPKRAAYEELAGDLRIDDRVEFVGDQRPEERLSTYRGAHVFVQTATHCIFPTEMLRALAAGCIGIVEYHANSSAHELVEGRVRGFRTTDAREMADAIVESGDLEHLTIDEDYRPFDEDRVIDRYLECYEAAIEARGFL